MNTKGTESENGRTQETAILLQPMREIVSLPELEEPKERKTSSFKFQIHAAAEKGKVKTLRRLLQKGDPLHVNFKRKTVLHYACSYPYQKKALQMVEIILNCPRAQNTTEDMDRTINLINFQDKNGETALHYAAKTGHTEVVIKLLFSAADVNIKDKDGVEPLHLIYMYVPRAMIPVFDGAIDCKAGDPTDPNLVVTLDFGAIVGYNQEPDQELETFALETKLLSYSLQRSEQKRQEILLHPLVQSFLYFKWRKIRVLLWISILFHMIWLLLYTFFICELYLVKCPYKNADGKEITCEIETDLFSTLYIEFSCLLYVTISVMIKEIYEIYSSPQLSFYLVQMENVGQWLLIGTVLLTAIPIFMKGEESVVVLESWQYQGAALGIFLAWTLILSQIGKIPRFAIYIEILVKVVKSFAMFMITFSSLLVAFMVSFQILMPRKVEFDNFPWSFMKVLIMMIGEINYDEMFFDEETLSDIPFSASTKLLYAIFVTIVTVILFNLLIGMTVSDIQSLRDVAQLSSLSSQLEQIYLLEKLIISKKLQQLLIRFKKNHWLRFFLVTQLTDDPITNMGLDIHISKVPNHLQSQIRDLASENVSQGSDEEDEDLDKIEADSQEEGNSASAIVKLPEEISFASKRKVLREEIKSILKELIEEFRANHAKEKRFFSKDMDVKSN